MSSEKIPMRIEDVITVVQALTVGIRKKAYTKDEFEQFREAWERLTDVVNKLQRNTLISSIYDEQTNDKSIKIDADDDV